MSTPIATLRQFRFFEPLDDAELEQLGGDVVEKHYPAHAILFTDSEVGDTFYLLKEGHVQIFKPTPAGDITLNTIEPGDHFGEMSLLDNQPRSASARTLTRATLIEMPKPVFLAIVQRFPVLLYRAAQVNSERLRRSDINLITELGERNKQLTQLYETSLDISRHRDIHDALSAITHRAATLLNSQHGLIHLYDANTRQLIAQSREAEKTGLELETVQRVFESGELAVEKKPTHQTLIVPIQLDTQMLGTLSVRRAASAPAFTQNDAQLLRLFANQAAIAIENARLFALALEKSRMDRELQVALRVQRSLMPETNPKIPGYQVAGLWRPAREVSGDFYDFIPLEDGKWGIVIADVCDKGMPAALFMATTRSVLRASLRNALNIATAIERANQIMMADSRSGMFVTLVVAVLDPRTHSIEYVNAGHNPPLWRHHSSLRLERFHRTGLPLAILQTSGYESRHIELAPNDVLLFYTDGVTDAMNEREARFGETRFTRLLKANPQTDAATLVHTIDRAVQEFVGNQPVFDDVTIVALQRRA